MCVRLCMKGKALEQRKLYIKDNNIRKGQKETQVTCHHLFRKPLSSLSKSPFCLYESVGDCALSVTFTGYVSRVTRHTSRVTRHT